MKHVEKMLHAHPFLTTAGNEQIQAAELIREIDILPSPRQIQKSKKRTKDECSGINDRR